MPDLVQTESNVFGLGGPYDYNSLGPITEPLPVEQTWQEREANHFKTGYYSPLPVIEEFEKYNVAFDREHFIHLSVKGEAEMIAFTASAGKGAVNRQTSMKFGRYLKAYCEHLTDGEIRACVIALRIAVGLAVTPDGANVVKFATDCETINRIFETDMSPCNSKHTSCMFGKFRTWKHRPYHVYANSPDVAVAYWERDGEIIARSVVSTKTKVWVRVYVPKGDETDCCAFQRMLEAAGYDEGELVGSRLSKLPMRNNRNLMPYVDNGGQWVRDAEDFWLVVECNEDGAFEADQTDGFGNDEPMCERCENAAEDCSCIYCECCDESYAGGCDNCSTCDECDGCHYHGQCSCERCEHCEKIIAPTRRCIDSCECTRCGECNALTADCECEEDEEAEENLIPTATEDIVLC